MSANKNSTAKRRRSGIDMLNNKVITNGHSDVNSNPQSKIVMTRLPKIAKSQRATGRWSRKISPAGVSYLKMDDEVRNEVTVCNIFSTFVLF